MKTRRIYRLENQPLALISYYHWNWICLKPWDQDQLSVCLLQYFLLKTSFCELCPNIFYLFPFIWWPLKVCSFDSISIKILEDKLSRPHIIWYLDILAKKTFPLCHLNIQWKIHNALHCLRCLRCLRRVCCVRCVSKQSSTVLLRDLNAVRCRHDTSLLASLNSCFWSFWIGILAWLPH